MKLLKSISICIFSLVLVMTLLGGVSAADTHEVGVKHVTNGAGITTVSYGIDSSYMLSIPINFIFTDEWNVVHTKVNATAVSLMHNEILNVTVSSTHDWMMFEHVETSPDVYEVVTGKEPAKIPYTLKFTMGDTDVMCESNTGKSRDVKVLIVKPGSSSGETDLTFTLGDKSQAAGSAGTFVDKLEFTSRIDTVDPPVTP